MAAAALCGRIRASFEAPAVRLPIAPAKWRFDTPGRCGESHGSPLGGKNHLFSPRSSPGCLVRPLSEPPWLRRVPGRSSIVERESAGYAGAGWSMLGSHSVAFEVKIGGFYPLEATHATLRSDPACRSATPRGRWAGGPRGPRKRPGCGRTRPRRPSAGSRSRWSRASVGRVLGVEDRAARRRGAA